MNRVILGASALVVGGPVLAAVVLGLAWVFAHRHRFRRPVMPVRPILVLLLIQLRSGRSILSGIQAVASRYPDHVGMVRPVRVAGVSGMAAAAAAASGEIAVLFAHLARSQLTGSSAADAVRRMLEADLAKERARRIARARALPVRLMLPVTLLLLPGVVLLSYGPSLLALLDDLVVPFV